MGAQVGGLDVVTLLAALLGCHCWGLGGGGCTSWRIGCGDVAGCRCWVPLLGCHCWAPLLAAIAGDRGGVYTLAALVSALITHKNWLVLSGVYAGRIVF